MVGSNLVFVLFEIFLPQSNLPGVFIPFISTSNCFLYSQFVLCTCMLGKYFVFVKRGRKLI